MLLLETDLPSMPAGNTWQKQTKEKHRSAVVTRKTCYLRGDIKAP